MNSFDKKFFKKYTPEGQEIQHIVHRHWINIIGRLFFWLFLWVLIPVFIYYFSYRAKDLIPFILLEIYLYLIYIKIMYDIFDWYNDVWIITDSGVVDLDWSLFKTTMSTINYENIEGLEVEQNSFIDKILKKGDLVIHKIGDDTFALTNTQSPYDALNIVEDIKHDSYEEEPENDRFDIMMDTLGGVVENYLQKGTPINEQEIQEAENKERFKRDKNSIDLSN